MKRWAKKCARLLLIFVLVLCVAAVIMFWRMTTLTVKATGAATTSPARTIETDAFKIDLPDYFFDETDLAFDLRWPGRRLFFTERFFRSRAEADDYYAQFIRPSRGELTADENLSESLGRPAVMRTTFEKGAWHCPVENRPNGPEAPTCLYLTLTMLYPKGVLTFNSKSGLDHPLSELADPGQRDLYLAATRAEFIELAREFLRAYTWLEESGAPDGPGYRTSGGFIAKGDHGNYTVSFSQASFLAENYKVRFNIWEKDLDFFGHFPPPNKTRFQIKRENQWSTGIWAAYNYYPQRVDGLDGFEQVTITPYYPFRPQMFDIVWQAEAKSDAPGEKALEMQLTNIYFWGEPLENLPGKMTIWRTVLDSVEIKPAND